MPDDDLWERDAPAPDETGDEPAADPAPDEIVEQDSRPDDGEENEGSGGPRFPVIFVHGHDGGLEDWRETIQWLVENDPRWDGFRESGTEDFLDWEPGSIPPSQWLMSFTYYNRFKGDARHAFTAGPGAIGSNRRFWCDPVLNWGHIPSASSDYYNGVEHEYAADLAAFIDRVLEATGAEKVDMVAHSMGGLVARSAIQFHGEYAKVRRLMLVSSPIHGLGLTDLGPIDPMLPRWMLDHEFAEMDDAVSLWDIGFYHCEAGSPVIAWHVGLNASDDLAAAYVTTYVIVGANDPWLSPEAVAYDHAEWEVVVPGANHNSIRTSDELLIRIVEYLGN
jgi:pimeloyl-ACP methyl ester carboxylesterase